jgi:hypothetical protein
LLSDVLAITIEFLRLALSDLAEVNDLVCHFTGPFLATGRNPHVTSRMPPVSLTRTISSRCTKNEIE